MATAKANTMRLAGATAMLVLLAGCAATEPASLANGQPVIRVTCSLAIDGMTSCFKEAGKICGARGYTIFDWNGTPWPMPYPEPETLQDDPGLGSGLLVACRPWPKAG